MGASPSADLYWGYDLGDMTDHETWDSLRPEWMSDDENEYEWYEVLAVRLGWKEVPFPPDPPSLPRYTINAARNKQLDAEYRQALEAWRNTPEHKAWSDSRDEMQRLADSVLVELRTYGSDEVSRHCVAVKESVQTVDDWGSIQLRLVLLIVPSEWPTKLAEFMKLLELPVPDESPGWHLNCSYG